MTLYYIGLCSNSNWEPGIKPRIEVVDSIDCLSPSLLAVPDLMAVHTNDPLKAARTFVYEHSLDGRIVVSVNTMAGCLELTLVGDQWMWHEPAYYPLDMEFSKILEEQLVRH